MAVTNTPDGGGGVSNELANLLSFLQGKLGGLYLNNPGTPPQDKAWVNLIRLRALFEQTGSEALLKQQQGTKLVTIHDLILPIKDDRLKESLTVLFGQKGTVSPNVNQEIGTGQGRAEARALVDAQWNQMEQAGGVEAASPAAPAQQQDPTGVLAPEQTAGADVDAIRAGNQQSLDGGDVTGAAGDAVTPAPSSGGGTGGAGGTPPVDTSLAPEGTPRQIPGGAELWRVESGAVYLAYTIPGTDKKMVWLVENRDRLTAIFGDAIPAFDRELSRAEFRGLSPWRGGLSAELVNTSEDPWQQFMSDFNAAAELRPWLKDESVQAVMAVAYLEGRAPTSDELAVTDWWNDHTADERAWMEESVTLGQAEVERRRDDASRSVQETLREAGMDNVPKHIADYIAEQRLTGKWSETYAEEQVRKLSDPFAPGTLDRGLLAAIRDPNMGSAADARAIAGTKQETMARISDIFRNANVPIASDGESEEDRLSRIADEVRSGKRTLTDVRQSIDLLAAKTEGGRVGGLDVNTEGEESIRATAVQWLGPTAGAFSDAEVARWAGIIRNDPNGQERFQEHLRTTLQGIFSWNNNPNATYESIVQPVANLARNIWGQEVDNDALLIDLANTRDYTEMSKRLRQQGLEQGIGKVVDDALAGLSDTALGQQVIRSTV